ncbi:hypothetical protein [Thermosulfurimonas sp. F29]|uniref:hypothetical protein n=1 Tax=Thermosulfurimonas sp. F29 TaxID=2867247 RepID=UPI001C83D1B3|nr:hypothetical protein [Thermosulfurimonas sp. F29]MBX6424134.1 hypothetical protein [Thermosulfurimonas sp. F29]
MNRDKHIEGYRLPLIPRGGVHRPRKGKGSYHREEEKRAIREGLREWRIERIEEDDGYMD